MLLLFKNIKERKRKQKQINFPHFSYSLEETAFKETRLHKITVQTKLLEVHDEILTQFLQQNAIVCWT